MSGELEFSLTSRAGKQVVRSINANSELPLFLVLSQVSVLTEMHVAGCMKNPEIGSPDNE